MRQALCLGGILFLLFLELALGAEANPVVLDFKLLVEGRQFEYKSLSIVPGRLTSLIQREKKEDPNSYVLEILMNKNQTKLNFDFSIARVTAGARETIMSPKIIGTEGDFMQLESGSDSNKIQIQVKPSKNIL